MFRHTYTHTWQITMNESHAKFQVKFFNCDSYKNSVRTNGTVFFHRCSHLFLFFSPVWIEDVKDFFHTCSLSVKRELKDVWLYVQSTGKSLVILHNSCFSHAFLSNVVQLPARGLVQPMNCFRLACCHLPTETERGCRGQVFSSQPKLSIQFFSLLNPENMRAQFPPNEQQRCPKRREKRWTLLRTHSPSLSSQDMPSTPMLLLHPR